ncbi:MAG: hypothetical protein ABWZ15_05310 [Acidimicrobiia bacterium]
MVIVLVRPPSSIFGLNDARDGVRIGLEETLRQEKVWMPVLVDVAKMPEPSDCPDCVELTGYQQALRAGHVAFRRDVAHLPEDLR